MRNYVKCNVDKMIHRYAQKTECKCAALKPSSLHTILYSLRNTSASSELPKSCITLPSFSTAFSTLSNYSHCFL